MEVFLTSPWVPAEWIAAHGLEPRGIWSAADFWRIRGPISAGVCEFADKVARFAEVHRDSTVIFTTACDQLRRGFDAAGRNGMRRGFLFNLPATTTPVARTIFRSELERLGQCLQSLDGRAPSSERLLEEMRQFSGRRQRLLESAPNSSSRSFAEAVAQFHRSGDFDPPPAAPRDRVPLALIGGPFLEPHWYVLDEIEAAGARVVLNATETGERGLLPALEGDAAGREPFDVLVNHCFENIVDVFQRPNARLYSWLRPRLASRGVRGIVLWQYTGCDLWRAEAETLREVFRLPVLLLEPGDGSDAAARDINRVQAFVETLR